MPDKEQRVRARAHEMWEQEGRPEGSHERHWTEAERQVAAESTGTKKPARKAPVKKAAAAPAAAPAKSAPLAKSPAKLKTAAPKPTAKTAKA